jgi:hypothetical protein
MAGRPKLQLIGKRFGRLTVVAAAGVVGGHSHWIVQCVCTTEKIVGKDDLLRGRTVSCGCQQKERNRAHGFKPGNQHGRCCKPIQKPA